MFDKHADEAIEAEIWLKAEAKGREQEREEGFEQGREQERAKNEVRDKKIAEYFRSLGVSEDKISKGVFYQVIFFHGAK